MATELADNVRKYRRRAGMSQEELAYAAGVSPGTVRKVEQGGTVRMETLHALARALRVTTGALMASDAPEPVGRAEEPNRVNLIQLRAVLTPAVGLVDQDAEAVGEEPNLRAFSRTVGDLRVLYFSDSYRSVAAQLPDLLRDATKAVAYYSGGDEHQQALLARAEALRLAGTYLTQVRQYDIAYTALVGAITDARQAGDMLAAGSGVGGMCWLLVRQGRLDEAERIAAQSMDAVEPKITGAEPDHYAVWGDGGRSRGRPQQPPGRGEGVPEGSTRGGSRCWYVAPQRLPALVRLRPGHGGDEGPRRLHGRRRRARSRAQGR
ncbi:helix-turn-helix domain-containing protein [Streptomyces sp. NPDC056492]|uniref:helix-turn-helix domain-containing protein n=1 Tax=unclassified Streptomyces TaxID=2593676 RepID=UPI003676E357